LTLVWLLSEVNEFTEIPQLEGQISSSLVLPNGRYDKGPFRMIVLSSYVGSGFLYHIFIPPQKTDG